MNTLFRIFVILVVAALIGGLMYVGVNASNSYTSFGDFDEGEGFPQRSDGDEFRPEHDEFEEQEGREGGQDGGFGFPGGVLKAVVLMSIAGGIYSAVAWAGKKAKKETSTP